MSVDEERVEDALAVAAVGETTLSQDANALLAEMENGAAENNPPANEPAVPPAEPAEPAADEDETGANGSSQGGTTDDEGGEEADEHEEPEVGGYDELMEKGGLFMAGCPQSQESVATDDGEDYMEERVRKDCASIKTATWMEKKVTAKTGARACPTD